MDEEKENLETEEKENLEEKSPEVESVEKEDVSTDLEKENEASPEGIDSETETGNKNDPVVLPDNVPEVETQTITTFETPEGKIHVVHDITFGDLIISTILMALLIFNVFNAIVLRGR